ncbi:glycosyltransferase family 2 protein, partial [Sphaerospermopsis aphanizomenoides BCCUSP55]|nr:glycosyltransferase family 2 protein [Sphaerospermopsis aphanizomenoides BCCUSP55]
MAQTLLNAIPTNQNTQTNVKLQNMILPNLDICTGEELYFRLNSNYSMNYEKNLIEINKSAIISFDTYLNAFSVQKWKEHTKIKTINVNVNLKGKFKISLFNINYYSQFKALVNQKIITNPELEEVCVFKDID